jgi:hypothetical protein
LAQSDPDLTEINLDDAAEGKWYPVLDIVAARQLYLFYRIHLHV